MHTLSFGILCVCTTTFYSLVHPFMNPSCQAYLDLLHKCFTCYATKTLICKFVSLLDICWLMGISVALLLKIHLYLCTLRGCCGRVLDPLVGWIFCGLESWVQEFGIYFDYVMCSIHVNTKETVEIFQNFSFSNSNLREMRPMRPLNLTYITYMRVGILQNLIKLIFGRL